MRRSTVLFSTGVFLLTPNFTRAQAPEKLEFEVASVRASAARVPGQRRVPATRTGGPGTADPGRISYSNQPLSDILAAAFGVYWNHISGPDWIATDQYDIIAKVPEGTTKEQARQMLQNLLVDRFRLASHMQAKTVDGYQLILAPGGSKMKAHSDEPPPQNSSAEKDPFPPLAEGQHTARRMSPGHIYARFADTSVSELARFLGNSLSAATMVMVAPGTSRGAAPPILDKTGLTGSYDFTFDYTGSVFFGKDYLPSILSAMESSLTKELGLKMVETKVPVSVLVIDRIDRAPAEN
jgi:uncharacterized protein (TIGR03435 family)